MQLAEQGYRPLVRILQMNSSGIGYFREFDGVMAMYHDQATTPFHSLYTEDGVIFTAGMPLIRTAADITPELLYRR